MDNVIVKVQQGKLRGANEKNINGMSFVAFRGVPYAKPPIGQLRFKDCEPMAPWFGVKNATKFSDQCAQQDGALGIIGSDNCLYLNIYTPMLRPTTPKAVMVWIHGGSFICGSGDDFLYGPDYLIEKDIVLVTINYRLGILGFLNVDDEEAPGNQGLKDQVMALTWIQQNIAQFGGDANNVTICGHSGGAACVHYLTISPLAEGLFHKAILQSGAASCPWAQLPKPSIEQVKKLAKLLNKDTTYIKEFVNYLRTLDAHDLVRAAISIQTYEEKLLYVYPFIPTLDRKAKKPFMIQPVKDAVKVGIKVPSICGYVSSEGLALNACIGASRDEAFNKIGADPENLLIHPNTLRFLEQHNVSLMDVKRFYFGDGKISSESAEILFDMYGAVLMTINIHNIIGIQSKIQNIPMHVYKFEYELEMSVMKKLFGTNFKGTCHGDDLGFLFHSKLGEANDTQPPAPNSIEHRLLQRFTEMWTNFAKIGNPTPRISDITPVMWKPVNNSGKYNYLKITDDLIMADEQDITQQLIDSKK